MEEKELQSLLKALEGDESKQHRTLIYLLLYTGMKRGEPFAKL
ncbi:MAG: hypothetical protein RR370_02520 [Synergistaceae bacterium]